MAAQLGGVVEGGHHREFGRAEVLVTEETPLVRGRMAQGRALSGVDEPRRPRHPAARGFPRGRHLGECADRHDRGRAAQVLRHPVPSRGRAHPARRRAHAQLRAQDRGLQGRLDHARLQGGGDRENPRAGRQGPRDLRALRRRRLRGRRRADPRGDRRAAHLRVRRPRPAAARRSGEGGGAVSRQLQHPARPRRGRSAVPRCARRRHRSRGQAQDHRQAVHRRVRRAKRRSSAAPNSWRRARSIPT